MSKTNESEAKNESDAQTNCCGDDVVVSQVVGEIWISVGRRFSKAHGIWDIGHLTTT
jgi:hypothetical protein